MLSESHACEHDYTVADSADSSAEDLTVQLLQSGAWHRKAISGETTACGQAIDRRHYPPMRRESYEGRLCGEGAQPGDDVCYGAFELGLADAARIQAEAKSKADAERHDREWRASFKAIRAKNRAVTGEHTTTPIDDEGDPE